MHSLFIIKWWIKQFYIRHYNALLTLTGMKLQWGGKSISYGEVFHSCPVLLRWEYFFIFILDCSSLGHNSQDKFPEIKKKKKKLIVKSNMSQFFTLSSVSSSSISLALVQTLNYKKLSQIRFTCCIHCQKLQGRFEPKWQCGRQRGSKMSRHSHKNNKNTGT